MDYLDYIWINAYYELFLENRATFTKTIPPCSTEDGESQIQMNQEGSKEKLISGEWE